MAKKFAVNTPIAKNILDRIGELPSKEELKKIQEEKVIVNTVEEENIWVETETELKFKNIVVLKYDTEHDVIICPIPEVNPKHVSVMTAFENKVVRNPANRKYPYLEKAESSSSSVAPELKKEPVAEIKTSPELKEVKPLQEFDKEISSQHTERIKKTEHPVESNRSIQAVKETRPVGRPKGKNTKAKTFGLSFKYQDTLLALVIREKRKGRIEFSQRFAMEEALDLLFAKHGIDFADARKILEREAELKGLSS